MKKKLSALFVAFFLSLGTINYAWSTNLIELVVPTPPGGAIDNTARAISNSLQAKGINNVVSYQPGAAGEIAIGSVLKKRDNVILVASSANFVFLDVATNQKVRVAENLQLFGPSLTNAMGFVVAPTTQFKSFKDLIDHAKQQELPCGVANSHGEIVLQRLNREYNTKFTPVMYKGTGQMQPNVVGGQLICAYDQTAPYSQLGDKVRWLATSAKNPVINGVPTVASALPNFSFETWYAVGIPNGSNLLTNTVVLDVLQYWQTDREAVQALVNQGFVVSPTVVNLNSRARGEVETYIRLLGIK
jgi:tripartite-type tricarboxylate transporter receptor subunit TctC